MCTDQTIVVGERIQLLSKPDGYSSQSAPLTVGAEYQVLGLDGSNVITSTDVAGETASYWRGRVRPA